MIRWSAAYSTIQIEFGGCYLKIIIFSIRMVRDMCVSPARMLQVIKYALNLIEGDIDNRKFTVSCSALYSGLSDNTQVRIVGWILTLLNRCRCSFNE